MDARENDPLPNTPNSSKQFGVLDLFLLTLSIAYVCGLVLAGQHTDVGADLIDGLARAFWPIVAVGLFAPLITFPGLLILLVVVALTPSLAPRLFLVMNVVTVFVCQTLTCLPPLGFGGWDPLAFGGCVACGAFLFLPAWVVHRLLIGRSTTGEVWWFLAFAGLANGGLIAFLCVMWVLASV